MATTKKSTKERLRQKAEKLLSERRKVIPKIGDRDVNKLVHELQVHQIELEMQNEELRRAQEEAEESRVKYSDLYDFSPVGYFTFSQAGEIAEVNLTGASLLGVERTKLVRRPFATFVDIGSRSLFRDHLLKVSKLDAKGRCELKLMKKDRKSFYVSLESIRLPHGRGYRVRSAVSDITELKTAQEEMESEHAFRKAIESSVRSGIAAVDLEGRQFYVSPGFCRMMGRSGEELLGRTPPFAYWPPEESDEINRVFQRIMDGKIPREGVELRLMRKNGERLDVLVIPSPLRDHLGNTIGWIGTFGEITHLKQMERELKQLNTQLEERVRQRTAELESINEQLKQEISERKHAEESLRYLATFPELNPTPIVEVDMTGAIHYLNPAAKQLFPDLTTSGIGHPLLAGLEQCVAPLKTGTKITPLRREIKIGNLWYDQAISRVPGMDRIRVYSRDITQRKHAEQESERLRAEAENEKRRLEAVMEALPVGVAITDALGGNIRSNKAFEQVWGSPRPGAASVSDYAAFKAWWSDTGKPLAPEEWASAQAVQKGRPVVGQLFEIQRFDGSRASVINSGAPIFDVHGKIAGSAVAIQDITQVRRVEEALQKSEKRYRSFIEMTEQLGWTTNAEGEVVEDMPAWRKFTAQSEEEIKGWGWSKAVHPDDIERIAQIWKNAVATKINYEVEYRIRRYDGIYRHFLVRGVPVVNDDGTIQEWVGTCIDISERKQMEEELRKSRDESEIKVKERTAELASANELLERMFSSVDVAIAYMDKEFNFIRVNRAYAEVDGREPEFYVGKNHFVLFPNEKNAQSFRSVVETGEPYSVYARPFQYGEHPERGVTYWDWSLQPVKNPDGTVTGVVLSFVDVTERVKAQEAVETERRRFNDVLEVLPAYLVLLAPDHHVPFANRFFRERFGESQGRRCFEYLFGRSEPCQVCESYVPLKTAAPHHWEWTGPDGCIYDVFDFPFTDTDGSTLILEMGIDITKRKQAEEALKAASLYTRSLIEASLDPLVTISPDGKIMDVNGATELATGVSRKDLVGTDFSNYFTDPEHARQGYRKVFSEGFVKDYPLALRRISGGVTDVLYNATVYKDENGEVQGVFAAARDVTERKRAEEALKEREALLRTMFETLPLGLWIADKQGRVTVGNQAGQQIWAGARYVGIDQFGEYKGWWLDTGKRIEPEDWAVARAVRKGETSINEEIEIECFDGSHKIILNSAVPIWNERQEVLGAFVINEDITERKRIERNLQQTQKMEALGTLAGGVAHDFNNILMPITINTELALLDTPEGSPLRQYLQPVLDAAKRGKELVGQIITFSRQKEAERKPVNVGPIVREAIQFLRSSLPRNIEIREKVEIESDTVLGDPTQIHQVLMNLSNNAAHAMRGGGGILDVRLTRSEVDPELAAKHPPLKQGSHIKLTVSDTGCGMNRDVMERVFDPFFTTKKPGEGTGMGLAVVHGIVKNHKGAITVYSEMGKGTTFNVFLPRIQDETKSETVSLESIPTGRERILVVDDEEPQLQSVTRMLEKLGYNVVGKSDSMEALDVFRAESGAFNLVITDQTMPKMTGEKLAKSILGIRPDIPIILCTGFSETVDADEAKALGIREFVMKPFTVREMAEKIRKVLGK